MQKQKPMTSAEIDLHLAVVAAMGITPIEGWSNRDLAEIIGCSEAAISRRVNRALLKVKQQLPPLPDPNK